MKTDTKNNVRDPITLAMGAISLLALAAGTILTFLAPPDVQQGYLSRAMPPHANTAWVSYLAFFVTAGFGLAYLLSRNLKFDRIAAASAELGVLLIGATLVTGMLWSKPTFGVYWVWEPRLTTTALMFVIYAAYIIVRGLIEEPHRRARVSGAIGVLASVAVPINYMSVYWWRSIHQTPTFSLAQGHSYLRGNPMLAVSFFLCLLGYTAMYLWMLRMRSGLAETESVLEEKTLEMSLGQMQTQSTPQNTQGAL